MVSNEDDLQALLIRLDRRYDRVEDGTFLVSMGGGQAPVALRLAPPVLVAQVEVGPAPKGQGVESNVFRMLLEKNATDLVHASYGLDGEHIMLSAALELESLDMNELEAVLADMGMALSEHVPSLKAMIEKKG
ncbi:MAG TPA: hypothetical protein PKA88_25575 [Polyangiaceae bacterium]|nr:hypothetical protein [Polyangiaceae bacterium]HMR74904.1 hypothetical protein [Polyangiaceae bacterium]